MRYFIWVTFPLIRPGYAPDYPDEVYTVAVYETNHLVYSGSWADVMQHLFTLMQKTPVQITETKMSDVYVVPSLISGT